MGRDIHIYACVIYSVVVLHVYNEFLLLLIILLLCCMYKMRAKHVWPFDIDEYLYANSLQSFLRYYTRLYIIITY